MSSRSLHGTHVLGATTSRTPTTVRTTTTAVPMTVTTIIPPPAPAVRQAVTAAAPSVVIPAIRAATMAQPASTAALRAAATVAPPSGAGARAAVSEQNLRAAADAKKKADDKKAAAQKKSSAAKSAASNRAIAAGQRLARHKRGRAGSKLVSLGRKGAQKATQVKGVVDTILGVVGIERAVLAVQSEINWEASLNALAQAADLAASILALADKVQAVDQQLAQEGYAIADQAQAVIDNYGGDALFDFFDNSIPGAVASVQGAASLWQAKAQSALSAGTAAQAAPPTPMDSMPPADGGGFGGGGGGGGGGEGGGLDDGGAEAEQTAAEMAAEAGGGGGTIDEAVPEETQTEAFPEEMSTSDVAVPEEMQVTEAVPEDINVPLQPGDQVTSTAKPEAGTGTVQLVVEDAIDVQWSDGTTTSEPIDTLTRVVEGQEVMGIIHGIDVLAGDAGTGGAPSAPMDYGPSIGPQPVYTDRPTIMAVQKALSARGYMLGPADGIFGPQTEAVLFKFSGKHGPPDEATLAALGVTPGGGSTAGIAGKVAGSVRDALARAFGAGPATAPAPTTRPAGLVTAPGWWSQPAWQGAPFKRWQAATAAGGAAAILTGITMAVRR